MWVIWHSIALFRLSFPNQFWSAVLVSFNTVKPCSQSAVARKPKASNGQTNVTLFFSMCMCHRTIAKKVP